MGTSLMPRVRGFTLIELLVVIAIIGVLVAIVLGVAGSVTDTGKKRLTLDTMRVLETALGEYTSSKGAIPGYSLVDPRLPANHAAVAPVLPVADARAPSDNTDGAVMLNSCGMLIEQLGEVGSSYEAISSALPTEVFRPYSPNTGVIDSLKQPLLPTAFDAWGNPIRYVHPRFDGLHYGSNDDLSDASAYVDLEDGMGLTPPRKGQVWHPDFTEIRRNAEATGADATNPINQPDSDGGVCPGGHPYFYSAGPDGDPSTTEDNVYASAKPSFQREKN